MNSVILISFVVPAYNAAATLSNCIQSIVCCKDVRIEVIIVENGSTDETASIAASLTETDQRVQLFRSEKGVSNARNIGIEKSRGQWIVFVDADDSIMEGKMDLMLDAAEKTDADAIFYGHCVRGRFHTVNAGQSDKVYVGSEIRIARIEMLNNPTRYMQAWAKLIRRSVLVDAKVFFDNRLRLSEDSDFILRFSRFCKKIVFSPECIYEYALNAASTMRIMEGNKDRDYIYAMNITSEAVENEDNEIKRAFQKYILMHLNILMVREIFNVRNGWVYRAKIKRMKKIVNEPIFQKAISLTSISECRNLRMLPVLFLKLRMNYWAGFIFTVRASQNYIKEKGMA